MNHQRSVFFPAPVVDLPKLLAVLLACITVPVFSGQTVLAPTSDPALPAAYKFQEYHYPEPADNAVCTGATNASAEIKKVYFAQTHPMEPTWPLFFLVSNRPALVEAVITGNGASPDVSVEGFNNGAPVGKLCCKGPVTLPATVVMTEHRFTDRFTVTLPSSWMQPGLSVTIRAGNAVRTFTKEQLKLGCAPPMNLVMVPFDILKYNEGKPDVAIPANFLADFAGALPATIVRLGMFPARIKLDTMVVSPDTGLVPIRIVAPNHAVVQDGNVNAVALRFVRAFLAATGDYAYCYYYGNTENFFPGGWGGGKVFVGADFTGVFIHEMGHALSLPHWGEGSYGNLNPTQWDYRYPYGGISNDGGGRGDSWNFYQNIHEFTSPICQETGNRVFGQERSDAMQRNNYCLETRSTGKGPWDGFGDFSALSIFRFMVGAAVDSGAVPYRGGVAPYHLPVQSGFPTLKIDATGKRYFERKYQPARIQDWERYDFLVPQQWDVPVYMVYGTYHPQYSQVNIIYNPLAYIGDLPRTIDPTDSATFKALALGGSFVNGVRAGPYSDYFWREKDLTFKFIYADGTVRYALYPYDGVARKWTAASSPWRSDLLYFAISIPADKKLQRIELCKRPFCVRNTNMTDDGNIANPALGITAKNFMNTATFVIGKDVNVAPPVIGTVKPLRVPRRFVSVTWRKTAGGLLFEGLTKGSRVEVFDLKGALVAGTVEQGGIALWKGDGPGGMRIFAVRDPDGRKTAKVRAYFR